MIAINEYIATNDLHRFYYIEDIPDKKMILNTKKTFHDAGKK